MSNHMGFIPGANKSTSKIIKYIALNNAINPNKQINECYCEKPLETALPNGNISNAMKISQKIRTLKGGQTYFGNYIEGKPLSVNYLGRVAGMPGGSGSPPLNKFN